MAFQVMARHPRWRSWIALLLVACVLGSLWMDVVPLIAEHGSAARPAASGGPQTKYDSMTLAELRAELQNVEIRHLGLPDTFHGEVAPLIEARNRLVAEKGELFDAIDSKQAEIQNERNAQDQLSQEAMRDWEGQLYESDRQRMDAHEQKARSYQSEVDQFKARQAQITDELIQMEIRDKPAYEAMNRKLAAAEAESLSEARIISTVAKRRFGADAVWDIEETMNPGKLMEMFFGEIISAPTVKMPEPVKSTVAMPEPDPKSRTGYLWRTLKRGLIDLVYERIPDFAGAAQRYLLVPFEGARAKLVEYLLKQGRTQIAAALAKAPPAVSAEAAPTIEAVVNAHSNRVPTIIIDNGNNYVGTNTIEVKAGIARGRSAAEWWENVKTSLKDGRLGKWLFGINLLFVAVAVWDIGALFAKGEWKAGLASAGVFVGVSAALGWAATAGSVAFATVTGTGIILGVAMVVDLYSRLTSFYTDTVDSFTEAPYVKFILDGEPCLMDGPKGHQVKAAKIGFFNFRLSPAFGLSRESWFLKFPSRASLNQALRQYRNGLAWVFMGQWNVPPKFDPGDNMVMFEKLVGREWEQKWTAYRKKLADQLEKFKADLEARAAQVSYPVKSLQLPDPVGHVFSATMTTDTALVGADIEFFQVFGVTGLPGDTLTVTTDARVVKAGETTPVGAPQVDTRPFALKVAEGIQVFTGNTKFKIDAPGEYEYVLSMSFDKPGTPPAPVRVPFRVDPRQVSVACGFDFDGAARGGAVKELFERLYEKLNSAIPTLPFFGQSNFPKDRLPLPNPSRGSYLTERTGLVPIPEGSKEDFTLLWSVGFNIEDTRNPRLAEIRRMNQEDIQKRLQKQPVFESGPFGQFSWLGAGSSRGTLDPAQSGDPYMGNAEVQVYDCLTLQVNAGLAIYADGRHGARDKPAVIDAVRTATKDMAMGASRVLHIAAMSTLQEVLPLMRERARIPVPTPGTYVGVMKGDAYNPDRSMRLTAKAGDAGLVLLEGQVELGGQKYDIKGTWNRKNNDIRGSFFYPNTTKESSIGGRYEQYRRAFAIFHGFDYKNDKGQTTSASYDYLVRFQGK